ncbi:MAG: amino acid permease [Breznakia sp.]
MSDMRKLGIPLLLIFISALLTKLLTMYVLLDATVTLVKIIVVITLCLFGASLNVTRGKRHGATWKKITAVLLVVFLLFMQLDLFTFTSVSEVFSFFGMNTFYINMLYIYCGYVFVD